jgi:hypothetical protein
LDLMGGGSGGGGNGGRKGGGGGGSGDAGQRGEVVREANRANEPKVKKVFVSSGQVQPGTKAYEVIQKTPPPELTNYQQAMKGTDQYLHATGRKRANPKKWETIKTYE